MKDEILYREHLDMTLDFHEMHPHISGYPGDLFGYKVKIHKNGYVSSPFAPFWKLLQIGTML